MDGNVDWADKSQVLAILTHSGCALRFASKELQSTREVVLTAVTQDGMALGFACPELRSNQEVVMTAVTQKGWALGLASKELQSTREVVMAAMTQDGMALKFASDHLRSNLEVVVAAVTQDGRALKYASKELRSNHEMVMAAVTQDGQALKYASEDLLSDRGVVLAAVTSNGLAWHFASKELQADRQVLRRAVRNGLADRGAQIPETAESDCPRAMAFHGELLRGSVDWLRPCQGLDIGLGILQGLETTMRLNTKFARIHQETVTLALLPVRHCPPTQRVPEELGRLESALREWKGGGETHYTRCQVLQLAAITGLLWSKYAEGRVDDPLQRYFSYLHQSRQLTLDQADPVVRERLFLEDEWVLEALHRLNLSSVLLDEQAAQCLKFRLTDDSQVDWSSLPQGTAQITYWLGSAGGKLSIQLDHRRQRQPLRRENMVDLACVETCLEAIEEKLREVLQKANSSGRARWKFVKDQLHALYQLLLQPVEEALMGILRLQRLQIVTPPELALVPWWGLMDQDSPGGQFLCEKFILAEVPVSRAMRFMDALDREEWPMALPALPSPPPLLIGLPWKKCAQHPLARGKVFESLPGVEEELLQLDSVFKNNTIQVMDGSMGLQDILDLLQDEQAQVVHLSTHGLPEGALLPTGEALQDAHLDAVKPRGKLLVLSACSLAKLGRSASVNGAAAVLCTTWVLYDTVAPKLMPLFYGAVHRQKLPVDEAFCWALRAVQRNAEAPFLSEAELLNVLGFKLLHVASPREES